MFKRFRGSDGVGRGTYLSLETWDLVSVRQDGDRLPGDERVSYVYVSTLLVLTLGPMAGLILVLFLPLSAPLFLAYLLAKRFWPRRPAAARPAGKLLGPTPVPR